MRRRSGGLQPLQFHPRRYRRIHRRFCFRALGNEQRSGLPPHPREIRTLQAALRRGQTASPTCGGRLMLRLNKVIKPWKESASLNDHINLYGFWNETAFLTKSGDLGMVLSVPGVDYESLDRSEQEYAVKRLEAALKAFGPGFHVYQYLFKSNRPDIPFAKYDDPIVEAAIEQRRKFFEAKRDHLYQIEIFYCILLEGSRSKTGVGTALARLLRDPEGAIAELKSPRTCLVVRVRRSPRCCGSSTQAEASPPWSPDRCTPWHRPGIRRCIGPATALLSASGAIGQSLNLGLGALTHRASKNSPPASRHKGFWPLFWYANWRKASTKLSPGHVASERRNWRNSKDFPSA